jgi:hypothetical protein
MTIRALNGSSELKPPITKVALPFCTTFVAGLHRGCHFVISRPPGFAFDHSSFAVV